MILSFCHNSQILFMVDNQPILATLSFAAHEKKFNRQNCLFVVQPEKKVDSSLLLDGEIVLNEKNGEDKDFVLKDFDDNNENEAFFEDEYPFTDQINDLLDASRPIRIIKEKSELK